jgi:thiaminase/transcriptional activator TenA
MIPFLSPGVLTVNGLAENHPLYLLWIMPAKEEWIMYSKFFSALPKLNFVPYLLKTPTIADNLTKIYSHVFNQQLFDGTLCTHAFGKYLHDDYIYLHHYALTLNKLSLRIENINPTLAKHLSYLSTGIVSGEQQMQQQYEEYFTYTSSSKAGLAISKYIDFLDTYAEKEELPVALCSILPCFWIYSVLGAKMLHPNQLIHNPYKSWIKAYSDADFTKATTVLVEEINKLANQSTVTTQTQMQEAFSQAVVFELEFFNEVAPINLYSFSPQSL